MDYAGQIKEALSDPEKLAEWIDNCCMTNLATGDDLPWLEYLNLARFNHN